MEYETYFYASHSSCNRVHAQTTLNHMRKNQINIFYSQIIRGDYVQFILSLAVMSTPHSQKKVSNSHDTFIYQDVI